MYGLLAMASNTVGQDILQYFRNYKLTSNNVCILTDVLPIETLAKLESAKNIL